MGAGVEEDAELSRTEKGILQRREDKCLKGKEKVRKIQKAEMQGWKLRTRSCRRSVGKMRNLEDKKQKGRLGNRRRSIKKKKGSLYLFYFVLKVVQY